MEATRLGAQAGENGPCSLKTPCKSGPRRPDLRFDDPGGDGCRNPVLWQMVGRSVAMDPKDAEGACHQGGKSVIL